MNTESEVFHQAVTLVNNHGEDAPIYAATRAQTLLDQGDPVGHALWNLDRQKPAVLAQVLRAVLEEVGCEVVEAENGWEGLRRFDEEGFPVVVCDILMPEKEGIETIREIRRKRPATKILAISGGGNARNPDFLRMTKDLGLTVLMETGPTPLLGDVPRSRS